jgi:hypothetical protein
LRLGKNAYRLRQTFRAKRLEPLNFWAVLKASPTKAGQMEAGYFIIAILGCADGSSQCTPVMTVPTHYATEAQCKAATREAVMAHTDFDFPSLLAECRPGAPRASADREQPRRPETNSDVRRG